MLTSVCPKLPMRSKATTRNYYVNQLGFADIGKEEYPDYLMVAKDEVELHFFLHPKLDLPNNDGQVYIRTNSIDDWHKELQAAGIAIHPNGALGNRPWGQREFSLLDPDHNLLTFGQAL